jgi:hypothetical protein
MTMGQLVWFNMRRPERYRLWEFLSKTALRDSAVLIGNPLAEFSASVPPAVMQIYVDDTQDQ